MAAGGWRLAATLCSVKARKRLHHNNIPITLYCIACLWFVSSYLDHNMRFFLLIASTLAAMTSGAENIVTLDLVLPEELVTSDADMLQHYGKPPDGCEADEQAFSIGGVPGMVCSPKCTDFKPCPTDVPDGVTAAPQCALENKQTGDKYCVLLCQAKSANIDGSPFLRSVDDGCGDATCQPVQGGIGVCTYS